jgi:AcrR family transcriptional regulator
MGTQVPLVGGAPSAGRYVEGGRSAQKGRTREALLAAARAELAADRGVTVESVAAATGISRTTAYRYFANQRDLIAAAHPQIDLGSLLPDDAPQDVEARLNLVLDRFLTEVTIAWEPQLRAALRLALEPRNGNAPADAAELRKGRGIGWILEALEPLALTHPGIDRDVLARAIRSAAGIESLVWLTDVGGLSPDHAAEVMRASAGAILRDAVRHGSWPPRSH